MEKVITPHIMQQAENSLFASGLDPISLMAEAGRQVFLIAKEYKKVLVVAYSGNNGGDGFVVADMLNAIGATVHVVFLGEEARLSRQARHFFEKVKHLIVTAPENDYQLVIDAILGIGFRGTLSGTLLEWVNKINGMRPQAKVLSIDIPSGLNGLTGEATVAVKADITVTFQAIKCGLIINKGRDLSGEIIVRDIGVSHEDCWFLLNKQDIHLKGYNNTDHKGTRKHLGIIGGAFGMEGALMLAGESAIRCGLGKVSMLVDKDIKNNFVSRPREIMLSAGEFSDFVKDKDGILFGPGAGRTESTKHKLEQLMDIDVPLVIDADGLYFLTRDMLKRRKGVTVITPHLGEAARLFNVDMNDLVKAPYKYAAEFALGTNTYVLLKSNYNFITDGKNGYFTCFGCPGMATAGSGDVLAGITAAMVLDNENNCLAALSASAYIHGTAGTFAQTALTPYATTASDIISRLGDAFKTVM